ncbi:MAG TPA: Flp pilus assembly protein CpaB [Caulobacteraceae bacterium]|jgi:pilus assembly protein CpaB
MGASRIIIIAVSAFAAIGLALIVRNMAARPPVAVAAPISSPQHPMTQVLVAKRDLPVGTRLAAADIGWQSWPADGLNAAFITDGRAAEAQPSTAAAAVASKAGHVAAAAAAAVTGSPMDALYGAVVRVAMVANEPVTQAKVLHGGEGGVMAVVLKPGMQAVAVPISVNTSAGGFILPGDHVDVLQSHQADAAANGGHAGFTASVLLRNIRILAIDQASQPGKSESMVGSVATLEVEQADAETLARAKAQGEVILALRSYGDAGGPSGRVSPGNGGAVRILRAGQASEVMVTP